LPGVIIDSGQVIRMFETFSLTKNSRVLCVDSSNSKLCVALVELGCHVDCIDVIAMNDLDKSMGLYQRNYYDFVISYNTLNQETRFRCLSGLIKVLHESVRKDGVVVIGLNNKYSLKYGLKKFFLNSLDVKIFSINRVLKELSKAKLNLQLKFVVLPGLEDPRKLISKTDEVYDSYYSYENHRLSGVKLLKRVAKQLYMSVGLYKAFDEAYLIIASK